MTCDEAQKMMLAAGLSLEQEEELASHLEACSTCEPAFSEEEHQLLGAWRAAELPEGLAQRTITRLQHEARPTPSAWRRFWDWLDGALGRLASHRATPLTGFATVMVFALLLVPVLSPHWTRGRSSGSVSGCKVNLRLLGEALDSYARDHQGLFPARLSDLEPHYVKEFPQCPQAGKDTYQSGYRPAPDHKSAQLFCHGEHHRDAGLGPDQPLIER